MIVRFFVLFSLAAAFFATGCTTCDRSAGRSFAMQRDHFAFTNELKWIYEFQDDGSLQSRNVEPAPEHPHLCFPMARATREFFYHARFDAAQPKVSSDEYRKLVQEVLAQNSRCPAKDEDRIVIPGYADLFTFSGDYPELVREELGGSWRSYWQRGNWRMIFPVSNRRERKTAQALYDEIQHGRVPIIHIYRFPEVRLNHGILVIAAEKRDADFLFQAYDPNNPGRPAELRFDEAAQSFIFERNQYFGGGPIKVYEVYRGAFY